MITHAEYCFIHPRWCRSFFRQCMTQYSFSVVPTSPSCCGVILLFDYRILRYQLLFSKSIWCAYVQYIYLRTYIYIYIYVNILEQYLEHYVYIYIYIYIYYILNSWYFSPEHIHPCDTFGGPGSGWRMLGFWESWKGWTKKIIGWKQTGNNKDNVWQSKFIITYTIPWDDLYIYLHDWLIFYGFHVEKYTNRPMDCLGHTSSWKFFNQHPPMGGVFQKP